MAVLNNNIKKVDPGIPRLGVWNRLEARPRREDFSEALEAQTADPLFLLTKQWQFEICWPRYWNCYFSKSKTQKFSNDKVCFWSKWIPNY